MRRILFAIVLILAFARFCYGQGSQIVTGPTLPPTCKPGMMFFNTTDGFHYSCSPANTWVKTGSGSGVATPAGVPVQTQVNNGGSPNVFGGAGCQTFANKDTGPESLDCDTHFKGPNPYIDVARYGMRHVFNAMPAVIGMTGNISSGSNSLAVSTASCPGQTGSICFVNGDGIVVYNAGPSQSMTTPTGVTVSPNVALNGIQTGQTVPGPTGATTYNYQVIAIDKQGGYTAASSVATTTTGAATLGFNNVNISTCSRANDIVTCTTSSAHGLPVGCANAMCGQIYVTGVTSNQNSFAVSPVLPFAFCCC